MITHYYAARLMVHKAAKSLENNEKESTVNSAMAKRYATDVCFEICK